MVRKVLLFLILVMLIGQVNAVTIVILDGNELAEGKVNIFKDGVLVKTVLVKGAVNVNLEKGSYVFEIKDKLYPCMVTEDNQVVVLQIAELAPLEKKDLILMCLYGILVILIATVVVYRRR
jgi:hypothetical protein